MDDIKDLLNSINSKLGFIGMVLLFMYMLQLGSCIVQQMTHK